VSIHEAVMARHSKDLVVGECKDGPTWASNHRRLDYWVLRRSWSRPAMIGYEVKSGRRDFLGDQKWPDYLPLCNELWFIADPKHVLPGELPEGVGHLRPAGGRLITVRRAAYREIDPPVALLLYVLICRAKVAAETPLSEADYWRVWLEKRTEEQEIGHRVSKALGEKYDRDVRAIRSRVEAQAKRADAADALIAALKARGIEWREWTTATEVEDSISVPKWSRAQVEAAHAQLGKLLNGTEVG
jgi:hypothetical protein